MEEKNLTRSTKTVLQVVQALKLPNENKKAPPPKKIKKSKKAKQKKTKQKII